MADHALVAGCDAYPFLDGADLAGAVGDALAMRDWLVGAGGVPAANVTLLASPSSKGAAAPAELVSGPAEKRLFAREVRRLVELPGAGPADRLFVYFAGHGCRTDPHNPVLARDALAFTGFSVDDPPGHTAGVEDLLARLRLSRFGAVVVLLDACRNFPFREPFQLGGLGLDPAGSDGPPPRMFLLQATLPGRVARGDRGEAGIRGRFTTAVLAGLSGDGAAKEYDDQAVPPYAVTWSTLARYVETAVADQDPRPRGEGELVLATFPEGHFAEVELTVSVEPAGTGSDPALLMDVSYRDPRRWEDPVLSKPGPAPARWRVPPRRLRVTARAGGRWGRSAVDAYADTAVRVLLDRQEEAAYGTLGPGRVQGGPPGSSGRHPADEDRSWDVERGPRWHGTGPVSVYLGLADPVAAIEVRSLEGRLRQTGVGSFQRWLTPGQYTVVVVDAEGREHREPLDVDAGSDARLDVDLPYPPGGENRPGVLRWAGAATAVAAALSERFRPDAFTCVVGGDRHTSALSGAAEVLDDGWTLITAGPGADRLDLRLGAHRLELPVAAGLTATVDLTGPSLQVAYFESARLGDDHALLILDRAQRLLNLHRPDAARTVLAARSASTAVDGVLLGASGHGLDRLMRERAPAGDRPFLLPGTPWAVLLDRPS